MEQTASIRALTFASKTHRKDKKRGPKTSEPATTSATDALDLASDKKRAINALLSEVIAVHPHNKRRQFTGLDLLRQIAINRAFGDMYHWRDKLIFFSKQPHEAIYQSTSPMDIVNRFANYGPPVGSGVKAMEMERKMVELGLLKKENVSVWAEKEAILFDSSTWGKTFSYEQTIPALTPLGFKILQKTSPWLVWALGGKHAAQTVSSG